MITTAVRAVYGHVAEVIYASEHGMSEGAKVVHRWAIVYAIGQLLLPIGVLMANLR